MTDISPDPVGQVLAEFVAAHPGAEVLDIGGGSGARAVPLAMSGCRVLVVDSSTDALASLGRRAQEAGVSDRVRALQADADRLDVVLPPDSADLILYHHVVQDVEDPQRSLAAAVRILRPGGRLSALVPGRLSLVLIEALAGRYEEATAILDQEPDSDRRYDAPSLQALLEGAGLAVESITGVGVVSALATGPGRSDPGLQILEARLGHHHVLGQIAGELHGMGIRPAT